MWWGAWIWIVVIAAVTAQPSGAKIFCRLFVGVGFFFSGVGGGRSGIGGSGLRVGGVAAGEHDLPRSSFALIADHEYVVAGAIKELGDHIASLSRAVRAKDSLVCAQSLDLCPRGGGYITQNLFQAGVLRSDEEAMAVPGDGGIGRPFVGRPVRRFGRRRRYDGRGRYRGLSCERIIFGGMLVPLNLLVRRGCCGL